MIKKSIKELAWDVTEDEYRAHEAVSYSMLAAFERDGAKAIPKLKEKKSSEALRFGSLVDTLMTEPEEFENKFIVADTSKVSETILNIVKNIYENSDKETNNLALVDRSKILMYANDANYYTNWKDDTRIDKIILEGKDMYSLLGLAGSKTLMTQWEYDTAMSCVETLKTHPFTAKYFYDDIFSPHIEGHYQLKFKITEAQGANVRCMYDRIIVDHEAKTIQPCDLKTTGKNEEEFSKSFLDWSYWIQSNMYSQILARLCMEDDYFKDFTILSFRFIVINKFSKTPLVWEDKDNLNSGDRIDQYGNLHKGWLDLYNEFQWHVRENKYEYSFESYHNGGLRQLNNIKVV